MEDGKINIEMENMIGKAYFSIATWYNKDFDIDRERQEALKETCAELVQQLLEDTFNQLNGAKKTEVIVKQDEKVEYIEPGSGIKRMFEPGDDPITRALKSNK